MDRADAAPSPRRRRWRRASSNRSGRRPPRRGRDGWSRRVAGACSRAPSARRAGRARARSVSTKPWSSKRRAAASHPEPGSAPMNENSAEQATSASPRAPHRDRLQVASPLSAITWVRPHGDARIGFDAVDQVARHALAEVVAADHEGHRALEAARKSDACPAELPPPATTTGAAAKGVPPFGGRVVDAVPSNSSGVASRRR